MATTAIALRARRQTVRDMTHAPTDHLIDTLEALAASGARTAPLLATQILTLTRHYEILGGAAHTDGLALFVPASTFNQVTTVPRTVPLATTASGILGGHSGEIADLLHLPVAHRGRLISIIRTELASLEVARPVDLEGLHLLACEALVHEADDLAMRQAVLAYAGLPPLSAKAAKQRDAHLPGSLNRIADLIDDVAARAGIVVQTADAVAHA